MEREMETEMYVAHLSTANFDFYLIADSEKSMWLEMKRAWNNHQKKTGAFWDWEEVKDSVWWNKQHINRVWKR
jgi:hypothetical protein